MMPLAGQVAVVTGASRGVGEATAKALAEQGATVVRLARTLADGEDGPYFNLTTDLTDPVLLKRAMDEVREEYGGSHTFRAYELFVVLDHPAKSVAEQLDINVASVYQAKTRITRALRDKIRTWEDQEELGTVAEPA